MDRCNKKSPYRGETMKKPPFRGAVHIKPEPSGSGFSG